VAQRDDVIDVGILRQQFGLDPLHREVADAGDALHGLGEREDVARPDRAIRVAVALERVARQRLLRCRLHRRNGQVVQHARRGHAEQPLVDPAARRDRRERVPDGHAITANRGTFGNVRQRHLVRLGDPLAQDEAGRQRRARRQAAIVGHDGHVVALVHPDGERPFSRAFRHLCAPSTESRTVTRQRRRAGTGRHCTADPRTAFQVRPMLTGGVLETAGWAGRCCATASPRACRPSSRSTVPWPAIARALRHGRCPSAIMFARRNSRATRWPPGRAARRPRWSRDLHRGPWRHHANHAGCRGWSRLQPGDRI
jgi:hypothetical protein